ncbi:MAG: hypothetical protein LBF12_00015 [Christensenellaceae bacterium]|jgi:hypothetical protein|nr:hypothetical protein [Christensenellaceae bacterium]
MCRALVLIGNEEIITKISSLFSNEDIISVDGQYLIIKEKNHYCMIMSNFKFGKTSEDDVARAYRKCKNYDISKITILSQKAERNVISFAYSLNIRFEFPYIKQIRKYFINNNIMPAKINNSKKRKRLLLPDFPNLFDMVLNEKQIFRYFFVFIILYVMSYFTFMKLYYLILSTIPLLLSLMCIMRRLKNRSH